MQKEIEKFYGKLLIKNGNKEQKSTAETTFFRDIIE